MVGLRVFDVGALVVWLVWFFKLRDDDDEDDAGGDSGPGGNMPRPDPPRGPQGGLELPRPDADPWPARRRDHAGDVPGATPPARRTPAPSRPRRAPRPSGGS